MKINEGRREGGVPFERMDHAQLIQGFSDQTEVADAHFLVNSTKGLKEKWTALYTVFTRV